MNKNELVKKLEFVEPVVNCFSFVSDFKNFHFNNETLAASDGIITAYTKSPIPEASFSVKADSFLNLLRNIDSEEVKLGIHNSSLSINTKHLEGKFNIGKPRNFVLNVPEDSMNIDLCKELLEGIYFCRFGVCKEKTSGAISGIRIEENRIFSTDRFRIHRYSLGVSSNLSPCTVPVKFAEIILKKKNEIVQYGILENRFYVVFEDGSLIETAISSDAYPPLEKYFEEINRDEFSELKFKTDLRKMLEKHLKSFLGGVDFFDRELRFQIENGICSLYSESKNSGNLSEEIELESDIGTHEFVVNPTLLQEVLQYGKGKFLYHPEDKIILLDAEKLQILIQTKV